MSLAATQRIAPVREDAGTLPAAHIERAIEARARFDRSFFVNWNTGTMVRSNRTREKILLIRLHTDSHIDASPQLASQVETAVARALKRFSDRITRVEVHLKDENSARGGERDKQCAMEARLPGLQPIAVNHLAPAVDLAVDGAAEKLARAIDRATARARKPPRAPAAES
jgi:ribosome-associated translation inhibitor RaiA